jgi:MATE family multidrug resistance protein
VSAEGESVSAGGAAGTAGTAGHPLRDLLRMAAPTVATMASYTVMTFVDGLMASRIGPEAVYVAAQGNGNIASFVPISVVMGVVGVISTFVSQHLGAGRPERGAAYAWNGLWICAMAAVALVPYALAVPWLFRAMGHGARLVELESSYARVLLLGAFLTMATRSLAQYFYGMHRPMIVLGAALAGNAANVFASVVLIFGPAGATASLLDLAGPAGRPVLEAIAGAAQWTAAALGVPALGLTGAAAGTLVGTLVELAIPLAAFLGPRYGRIYGARAAWRPSARHLREIVRLGWAPGLMFGNEIVCWAIFLAVLVAGFGTEHNTAGWIALRYMHLSFMPAVGISYAVTALVGRCMGMGRPDLAARRAMLGLGVTVAYMGACALAFVLFPRAMVGYFIDPATGQAEREAILAIGVGVMYVAAVFQVFDAMGITLVGALRGAGDTVWPGAVTILLSWTCIVGVGGALAWARPGWGSLGPWSGAGLYIVLLGIFLVGRFVGGRWKGIRLVEAPGPGGPGIGGGEAPALSGPVGAAASGGDSSR